MPFPKLGNVSDEFSCSSTNFLLEEHAHREKHPVAALGLQGIRKEASADQKGEWEYVVCDRPMTYFLGVSIFSSLFSALLRKGTISIAAFALPSALGWLSLPMTDGYLSQLEAP